MLEPIEDITSVAILQTQDTVPTTNKLSKKEIRSSLKASTLDSIFSTIFACVTAEVLLSNFLVELGATSVEIGFLLAIPMLCNFIQPVGAYFADKTTSRRQYILQTFAGARLLWLILVIGIINFDPHFGEAHQLIQWTLLIVLLTHILGALGSASWVSWMAVLVPPRLRGRYFGLRNSAANLTNLLCVPLLGQVVSHWKGGSIEAYGFVLILAVLAGIISIGCQLFMVDVNPQESMGKVSTSSDGVQPPRSPWKDTNFLKFLLFYGLWMFAVNLSAPFFNIYLLKDLDFDVSWVTFYSSLTAGANVLMLIWWGKLIDRVGNRPILILVGVVVALTPLLWLWIGTDFFSVRFFIPLLYLLAGGTLSAIELCNSNLQMEIAPSNGSSSYFAIAAAWGGLGGALGTTAGGFLADVVPMYGFLAIFALSAILRLVALLPIIFVREPRSQNLSHLLRRWLFLLRLPYSVIVKRAS